MYYMRRGEGGKDSSLVFWKSEAAEGFGIDDAKKV